MKKGIIIGSILLVLVISLSIAFLMFFNMSLVGSDEEVILGDVYKDAGVKVLVGKGLVNTKNSVDINKVGEYIIEYKFLFTSKTRTVKVIDNTSPVLTLIGEGTLNLRLGTKYEEEGYKAVDDYDGDITDKVSIDNPLDINNAGEYKITYIVKDSSGNESKLIRTVNMNDIAALTMNIKEFNLDGYFKGTILEKTENAGDKYINETIFYGDSINNNLHHYGTIPLSRIWGRSSLTPENAHTTQINEGLEENKGYTFYQLLERHKPKRVILLLGADALYFMTNDYFVKEYEKLIIKAKEVSPDTSFIIQSVLPVTEHHDIVNAYNGKRTNDKINKLNYYLAEMCQRQKIKFLNSAEVVKDSNGRCAVTDCYESDGIHPYGHVNLKIIEYIKTHAEGV